MEMEMKGVAYLVVYVYGAYDFLSVRAWEVDA